MQNITNKTYIKRKTISGSKSPGLEVLKVTKRPHPPAKRRGQVRPFQTRFRVKPDQKWLTCSAWRLSPSVHKKRKAGEGRGNQSEKLTHAHLHFKAFKAAEEEWFELSLILLLSRLSKFTAEEGERGKEGGTERVLLVFIRDNFLIFFLCAFWRLKLDPLQMRRGKDRRSDGKVPTARHASRSRKWREGAGGDRSQ